MTLQSSAKRSWLLGSAIVALLLAGLYIAQSLLGVAPPEGTAVLYPALLLYNYTALPAATTILLLALLVLVLWIPQAIRRLPRFRTNGLAAGALVIAAATACLAGLPRVFVGYLHLARVELNGHAYQLGVRTAADGNNYYVLCECDRLGVVCTCRNLPQAGPPNFVVRPGLVADAGQTLTIVVGTEAVYTIKP